MNTNPAHGLSPLFPHVAGLAAGRSAPPFPRSPAVTYCGWRTGAQPSCAHAFCRSPGNPRAGRNSNIAWCNVPVPRRGGLSVTKTLNKCKFSALTAAAGSHAPGAAAFFPHHAFLSSPNLRTLAQFASSVRIFLTSHWGQGGKPVKNIIHDFSDQLHFATSPFAGDERSEGEFAGVQKVFAGGANV